MTTRGKLAAAVLVVAALLLSWLLLRPGAQRPQAPAASAKSAVPAAAPAPAPARVAVPLGPLDPTRGAPDALVTLVEFGNYESPQVRAIQPALERLLTEYPSELRLVWKDAPAAQPWAIASAKLARAVALTLGPAAFARTQQRLWAHKGPPDASALAAIADEVGLDAARLQAELAVPGRDQAQSDDALLARRLDATAVPYFFVNGRRVSTATYDGLKRMIDEELGRARGLLARGVAASDVYAELMKDATVPSLQLPPTRIERLSQELVERDLELGRAMARSPSLAIDAETRRVLAERGVERSDLDRYIRDRMQVHRLMPELDDEDRKFDEQAREREEALKSAEGTREREREREDEDEREGEREPGPR